MSISHSRIYMPAATTPYLASGENPMRKYLLISNPHPLGTDIIVWYAQPTTLLMAKVARCILHGGDELILGPATDEPYTGEIWLSAPSTNVLTVDTGLHEET